MFYWFVFVFFSLLAIFANNRHVVSSNEHQLLSFNPLWWLIVLFFTFVIGMRHEIGGDWGSYLLYFESISSLPLTDSFDISADAGYVIINYISSYFNLGIYGVNLFCGFVFSLGLSIFCRSLPRPLLALACAIPYLFLVVSMGYSRQGVALGFAMIALVFLGREKKIMFCVFILLAALFHKTAISLLPIAALAGTKNKALSLLLVLLIGLIIYLTALSTSFDRLIEYYIRNEYKSQGAFIRLLILLVPSIILLVWPHRFNMPNSELVLWKTIAWISLSLLFLLIASEASTAIDRMALYLLPIQLVVFSYLPEIFGERGEARSWLVFLIICYYGLFMGIWLNYSVYVIYWLPYKNLLFI
jgi:hypothetical protein